jgi:hypothetical protein
MNKLLFFLFSIALNACTTANIKPSQDDPYLDKIPEVLFADSHYGISCHFNEQENREICFKYDCSKNQLGHVHCNKFKMSQEEQKIEEAFIKESVPQQCEFETIFSGKQEYCMNLRSTLRNEKFETAMTVCISKTNLKAPTEIRGLCFQESCKESDKTNCSSKGDRNILNWYNKVTEKHK